MTLTKIKTLMAAAVATLLLSSTSFAMTNEQLKVQTTETVRVGESVLPAGSYTIRVVDSAGPQPVLAVTNADGATILVPVMRGKVLDRAARPEVQLRRDGTESRLTAVQFAGAEYGYEVIAH